MIRIGLVIVAIAAVQIQGTEGAYVKQTVSGHHAIPVTHDDISHLQGVDCDTCKTYMTETKRVLETSAGPTFDEEVFSYFCKEDMGDFSDLCKQLFKTYFEKLRELVLLFLSPDAFCPALDFCSLRSGYGVITHAPSDAAPPSECDNCTAFFGQVVARLKDPAYTKPLVDLMKTFCIAGCATYTICVEAAEDHGAALLNVMGTTLQAEDMCTQIGACPPPSAEGVSKAHGYKALLEYLSQFHAAHDKPDLLDPDRSRSSDPENYGYQTSLTSVQVYPDCDPCRWYMYHYHTFLQTEIGEQLISKVSTDVCKDDAGIYVGLCTAVIRSFRDTLLQEILDNTDAPHLCPLFSFCPTPSSKEASTPAPPVPVGYQPSCDDCVSFVMKMEAAWKNPATQLKLVKHLSASCLTFCAFKDSCEAFFDVYGPSFITTIADEALNPLKACKSMTYCPAAPSELEERKIKKNMNSTVESVLCKSCLSSAHQMEGALANSTKGDYGRVLTKFCSSSLPESLRGECRSLADGLQLARKRRGSRVLTLAEICRQLSVCLPGTRRVR